jgi:hypothetical protein
VVSFNPQPLYPWGKSPWYLLRRRLGGPKNRSRRRGEGKNLAPTGIRTPNPRPSEINIIVDGLSVSSVVGSSRQRNKLNVMQPPELESGKLRTLSRLIAF